MLSTRDATFVVYTPISRRESHHLVVSFTPTTPAPFGLGCVSLCVLLCRSVSRRTTRHSHTRQHGQITRSARSLAQLIDHSLLGAVIPRDDNQSSRGMDLLVVSQLRFSGPVPWVICLYGPVPCSAASTGQLAQLIRWDSSR